MKVNFSQDLLSSFTKLNKIKNFRVHEDIPEKIEELICKHPLISLGFEYDVKVFPSNHVTAEMVLVLSTLLQIMHQ